MLGSDADVDFAPYNQVFQQLLTPESLLRREDPGAGIVLLRLEDLCGRRPKGLTQATRDAVDAALGDIERHRLPNGVEIAHLKAYETDYLYDEIFVERTYLKHGIDLPEDAVVFDIGANVGMFSLFVADQSPDARIIAVEPSPVTHAVLDRNLRLYAPDATTIQAGISDRDREAEFTFYPNSSVFAGFHAADDDKEALRAIVANELEQAGRLHDEQDADPYLEALLDHRLQREQFRCPLRSLSNLIREHDVDRIDLLKIDAEKCESEILDGIAESDWPKIRQIVVEVHDKDRLILEDVRRRLSARGFDVAVVEERALARSGLYNVYGRRPSRKADVPPGGDADRLRSTIGDLVTACRQAATGRTTPLIVALCPPSPAFAASMPDDELAAQEARLAEGLEGISNVSHVRLADYADAYDWGDAHDAQRDAMGRIPYTPRFFAALATVLARRLHRLRRASYQVIALDCDNTLWSGVVGELGAAGVDITPAFQALQRFMQRQKEQGMLLCLVSKNDEADVRAVFESRLEMVLAWDDITLTRVNWDRKSDNLRTLADELKLGLDSIVFVDDNPIECAEVKAATPQVLALNLPADQNDMARFLERVWAFDHLRTTAEDARRTELYRQELARERSRDDSLSLKDFIDKLELEIRIEPAREADLPRLAQLTERTNQFNVHKNPLNEAAVKALAAGEDTGCFALRVADRFGDYGLCGLATYAAEVDGLRVDAFLMSCRVLGRGVEHRMLSALGAEATRRGLGFVRVPYIATARSKPAETFLHEAAPAECLEEDDRVVFVFAADELAELEYLPREVAVAESSEATGGPVKRPMGANASSILIQRIATDLATLDDVLAAMRLVPVAAPQEAVPVPPVETGRVAGLEAHARQLVLSALAEQLGVDEAELDGVSAFASFGVDSIGGIDLIVRLNETLGIVTPPTVLFDHVCVDDLAAYLCRDFAPAVRRHMGEPVTPAAAEVAREPVPASTLARPAADDAEAVAVIGYSGRFPGAADVDAFWALLAAGRDAIAEVPPERWRASAVYDREPGRRGTSYSSVGGFLDDIDMFDADFFGIPDGEAAAMDPQQRLFLQECWRALEDAGYAARQPADNTWGVYVGTDGGDYAERLQAAGVARDGAAFVGSDAAMLASRIAYFLNLKGGALALDAACASSLSAVHLDCRSLLNGDMDLVIAGGASIVTTPKYHVLCSQRGMLATDGHCKPFDDSGDGFVIGEAVGAVVLKRLTAALRDGDPIHGVIRGSALNQDGATNGITAPSSLAQSTLALKAYAAADVDPADIGYVEAHGTGTRLGDSIEVQALTSVFRDRTDRTDFCALGSAKGNIGHCLQAAGIGSLIKLLLCLKHGQLPPSANFKEPNRHIDFAASPFYVNTALRDWIVPEGKTRIGAVSALGFNGTNVHMVVTEPPELPVAVPAVSPCLVVLSARTPEALVARAQALADWLDRGGAAPDLSQIAYTLLHRTAFAHRLATVVSSAADLRERLDEFVRGVASDDVLSGTADANPAMRDVYAQALSGVRTELAALNPDEDATAYLRCLRTLAALFVGGVDLEAGMIYPRPPRRISLPTYPFAGRRYWVDLQDAPGPAVDGTDLADKQETVSPPRQPRPADLGDPLANLLSRFVADRLRLDAAAVDVDASFMTLGLASRDLVQMVQLLEVALGVRLSPALVFDYVTIDAVVAHLNTVHTREVAQLDDDAYARATAALAPSAGAASAPGEAVLPLSSAQLGLWSLQQAWPGMSAYNVPLGLRLPAPVARGRWPRRWAGWCVAGRCWAAGSSWSPGRRACGWMARPCRWKRRTPPAGTKRRARPGWRRGRGRRSSCRRVRCCGPACCTTRPAPRCCWWCTTWCSTAPASNRCCRRWPRLTGR